MRRGPGVGGGGGGGGERVGRHIKSAAFGDEVLETCQKKKKKIMLWCQRMSVAPSSHSDWCWLTFLCGLPVCSRHCNDSEMLNCPSSSVNTHVEQFD